MTFKDYNPFFLLAMLMVAVLASSCGKSPEATAASPEEDTVDLPPIMAYLVCEPSEIDGQGTAVVSPSHPIPMGSVGTFEITFTVGEAGIKPMGFVIFQISPYWGWSSPQTWRSGAAGYTEVVPSFEDPSLEVYPLKLDRILVFSRERGMLAGETIKFRYGPARVDRYAEKEELFQIFVDADGDGHHACIEDPPKIEILPAHAVALTSNAPSRAAPGDEVTVTTAGLDMHGNWTAFPAGEYTFSVEKDGQEKQEVIKTKVGKGGNVDFKYRLPDEGIYFFHIENSQGMQAKSNVCFCQMGSPSLNLYFGDIHGHTRLSDGTGTPEDYYRFARDVCGLDMAAITDHADYGTIPFGTVWDGLQSTTNEYYDPGNFLTFVAFEWTNWTYGHRNVYFRGDSGPFFRSFDEHSDTPQELWALLEPYDAMTVAHHVGGGPIATDWSIPPGPKEWLVEISSIHGSSEVLDGSKECIYHPKEGHFVRDALNMGYRLGIIASGDTHDGHPGKRSTGSFINGLVAVYAEELTRESVWEAFKRRQVYGTSGAKIILFFRVGNAPMGSEVTWARKDGGLPVALMTVGCDEIDTLEIIRNGEVVLRQNPEDTVFAQLLVEDEDPLEGESWYYARVTQKDGNRAWSSPVWVTCE